MMGITSASVMVMSQFMLIVFGILMSFLMAVKKGGGEIPLRWHPPNSEVRAVP
jgi:hypothetical protein